VTLLTFNLTEWKALETVAARTTDAHILRRAQALLWLDEGETVPEVAAPVGGALGALSIAKIMETYFTESRKRCVIKCRGTFLVGAIAQKGQDSPVSGC
jgi:hypothetical protein